MKPEHPSKGSLLVIFLTVFIDLLGFGIVLPLLPIYAQEFITDRTGWKLGVLMASFSAMQFIFAPIWGRISDRIGRRPVLMVGLLGSVVSYTLFGWATLWQSFGWLLIARIGAGIAGATVSTAQAYIADTTSLEQRPRGMALIGMAFGLGFTLGPLVGYLAVPTGVGVPGPWPGYVAAGLSALALGIACFRLPESRQFTEQVRTSPSRWQQLVLLRHALRVPSIAMLLLATFVCIFSFANFETTLSMVMKGTSEDFDSPFHFDFSKVCLTYAYIGFVLTVVQGGIVRRLSGRIREGTMARWGAILEIIGFLMIVQAIRTGGVPLLLGGLAVVVAGFAMISPSLNSLISRRSDPEQQGGILGVSQSVNSLARILGPLLGIPLLKVSMVLPYLTATGLMALGLVLVFWADKQGTDYASPPRL